MTEVIEALTYQLTDMNERHNSITRQPFTSCFVYASTGDNQNYAQSRQWDMSI